MKILSYNVFGKKESKDKIPDWDIRVTNLIRTINDILKDDDIKILCFQEVNENNMDFITAICNQNNFDIIEKFPMKTRTIYQYNIIGVRNNAGISIKNIYCLPHGEDTIYQPVEKQIISYGMSDYRTTLFVKFEYDNLTYIIGDIHTDYKSTEGIIKGVAKSLDYMDNIKADYKIIVGDMNMPDDSDILKQILGLKPNYSIVSNNSEFDKSYHAYGNRQGLNIDFAFVDNNIKSNIRYNLIKQSSILLEGSDHRPVILEAINI